MKILQKIQKKIEVKKKKGFTIVETLITLLAISIMIAGPVTFAYKSFSYAKFVKYKMEALSLSQEGLELATSLRNGSANKTDFSDTVNGCSIGCAIDWNGESSLPTATSCDGESCRLFEVLDAGNKTFRHIGDQETDYLRQVKFTKNAGDSYTVESRVWRDEVSDEIKLDVILKKIIYIYDVEY
jgi:Tfp pilus assembly protein PilV